MVVFPSGDRRSKNKQANLERAARSEALRWTVLVRMMKSPRALWNWDLFGHKLFAASDWHAPGAKVGGTSRGSRRLRGSARTFY